MKSKHSNKIGIVLTKLIGVVITSTTQVLKKISDNLQADDQNIRLKEDEPEYWKDKVYRIVSTAFIICGAPLVAYGSMLFRREGSYEYALGEVLLYIIIVILITRKSLSVRLRKLFITLVLFIVSILLLITTGIHGSGMIFLTISLIVSGCLLEKKQILQGLIIDVTVFIVLTLLLELGYFDGTKMETYKVVWLMHVLASQSSGIILLYLVNVICNDLEKQTQIIKTAKDTLIESEMKHKAMIANISDVILIVDENGMLTYNSPNLEGMFGYTSEEICNRPLWSYIHPEDQVGIKNEFLELLENEGVKKTVVTRSISKEGDVQYLEITAVNLIRNSTIKGILINYHDITAHKTRENKILHLSYHDSLTELYNRTYFEIEKSRLDTENQLPLSVITCDINGLKMINDALGHAEGDKLIITTANILERSCRKVGVIARIGGDEFTILLPKTTNEVAYELSRKINAECTEYNNKVTNELYYISISMGVATKTCIGESIDNILKVAEDYMYKGKLLEGRSFHSSIISSMKTTLFEKSQETEEHAQRLIKYSKEVGRFFELTEQQFDELELFAMLHDIGKIGVDDQILNKPGKLSDTEWVEMKKHAEIGYRIAMASPELVSVAQYILTHHERWDGTGYPLAQTGKNIPLLSRILAVVDAYDAMTEDRPYRKGMLKQEALNEIRVNAGTQFDPEVANIFIGIMVEVES